MFQTWMAHGISPPPTPHHNNLPRKDVIWTQVPVPFSGEWLFLDVSPVNNSYSASLADHRHLKFYPSQKSPWKRLEPAVVPIAKSLHKRPPPHPPTHHNNLPRKDVIWTQFPVPFSGEWLFLDVSPVNNSYSASLADHRHLKFYPSQKSPWKRLEPAVVPIAKSLHKRSWEYLQPLTNIFTSRT